MNSGASAHQPQLLVPRLHIHPSRRRQVEQVGFQSLCRLCAIRAVARRRMGIHSLGCPARHFLHCLPLLPGQIPLPLGRRMGDHHLLRFATWPPFYETDASALFTKVKILCEPASWSMSALSDYAHVYNTGELATLAAAIGLSCLALLCEGICRWLKRDDYAYAQHPLFISFCIICVILLGGTESNQDILSTSHSDKRAFALILTILVVSPLSLFYTTHINPEVRFWKSSMRSNVSGPTHSANRIDMSWSFPEAHPLHSRLIVKFFSANSISPAQT